MSEQRGEGVTSYTEIVYYNTRAAKRKNCPSRSILKPEPKARAKAFFEKVSTGNSFAVLVL